MTREEIKEKIKAIIFDYVHNYEMHIDEAVDEIIALFEDKEAGEWECILFVPDTTTSATKCKHCGKEKHQHTEL